MKTYIVLFTAILISSLSVCAQETTITAEYLGYVKDNDVYKFENQQEKVIEFHSVSSVVLKKYNLKSDDLIFETFIVTFTTIDNNDEPNRTKLTVLKLELIETEVEDDEDEDAEV